jgi:hypothetical protein
MPAVSVLLTTLIFYSALSQMVRTQTPGVLSGCAAVANFSRHWSKGHSCI